MRWSSTSRAIAPWVHSHRDARRIGSNQGQGANPCPIVLLPAALRSGMALRLALSSNLGLPTDAGAGPVRRLARLRGSFAFHLAVPRADRSFCVRTLSLAGRAPFRCQVRAFVPLSLRLSASASLSSRTSQAAFEPADSRAPLAASSVREVLSEDFAKRVFRRCCGHRSRLDRVEFLRSLSGG